MRVLFTLIIVLSLNQSGFSQTDSVFHDLSVYNTVYKNIISYNIYNASYNFNGINVNESLKPGQPNPFDGLIADFGYKLNLGFKKLDWQYPNKEYNIYDVTLDALIFEDSVNNLKIRANGPIINKHFLIGIRRRDKNILFISGQFFKHEIAEDFQITIKKPESLIEFLKYKTFQYQMEDIHFLKNKRNELWFKGYSASIGKNLIIKVPKRHVDDLSFLRE